MINNKVAKTISETPNFYTVGPFMTTSGCLAPIYMDIRRTFSDPVALKDISKEMAKLIRKENIKFDFIVGGATAGIQISTSLGLMLKKYNGYVRKKPKEGGTGLAVEGNFKRGMNALLVDDACAHGASKLIFVDNIRKAEMKIKNVIAVYSRNPDNFEDRKWIKQAKVNFYELADISSVLNYSYKHKIITKEAHTLLNWYKDDAANWNKDKEKWEFFENYLKIKKNSSSRV